MVIADGGRVLVAAPSNKALDVVLARLLDAGQRGMLRMGDSAQVTDPKVSITALSDWSRGLDVRISMVLQV